MLFRSQRNGFEATDMAFRNDALILRGIIADDMSCMPLRSTPSARSMMPVFFFASVFESMKNNTPVIEIIENIVDAERRSAAEPPMLDMLRIQPVAVVPMFAPIIIGMPCTSVIIPELTNPTTMTEVAEDDWMTFL